MFDMTSAVRLVHSSDWKLDLKSEIRLVVDGHSDLELWCEENVHTFAIRTLLERCVSCRVSLATENGLLCWGLHLGRHGHGSVVGVVKGSIVGDSVGVIVVGVGVVRVALFTVNLFVDGDFVFLREGQQEGKEVTY
jgi:hypothetical protein